MRKNNSLLTISFVVAMAALFASGFSSANLVFAQTNTDDENEDSENYQNFVKCLSDSEGEKGFSTEDEIRDCFRPIYDPNADVANSDSNTDSDSNN